LGPRGVFVHSYCSITTRYRQIDQLNIIFWSEEQRKIAKYSEKIALNENYSPEVKTGLCEYES